MLNTNESLTFEKVFSREIKRSTGVDIAVGYCGLGAATAFHKELVRVARKGRVRLILGMYRVDGSLSKRLHDALTELHRDLRLIPDRQNDGTGVYVTTVDYHGKLYLFDAGVSSMAWIGSNNFSDEGLKTRLELCTQVVNPKDLEEARRFVDSLCDPMRSITIDKLGVTAGPAASLKQLPVITKLPTTEVVGTMCIRLRPSEQPKSALNLCFGSGRRNLLGIYTPRPWYEIELSACKEETSNPVYPKPAVLPAGKKGARVEFKAYLTNDGVRYRETTLSTYSDGNKALGSNPRNILGEFIKGTLERAGVLRRGELITDDTLAEYARDYVTLTKLDDGSYVLTF